MRQGCFIQTQPDEQWSQRSHGLRRRKWTIWLDGSATAWSDPWRRARQASNPFEVHMIPLFAAHDGGKPVHMLNAAHLGATAIQKVVAGACARTAACLELPGGAIWVGGGPVALVRVEGPDYSMDAKGNPVLTDRGNPYANYLPFNGT